MSDEAFSGWHVVAFLLGVLAALLAAAVAYLSTRPARRREQRVGSVAVAGPEQGVRDAWVDTEKGMVGSGCTTEKACNFSPRQLRETLRQLLESELPKGFRQSGLAEQLDRLEEKVSSSTAEAKLESKAGAIGLRAAAKAESDCVGGMAVQACDRLNSAEVPAATAFPELSRGSHIPATEDLPGAVVADTCAQPQPPQTDFLEGPRPPAAARPGKEFGPTPLQLSLPEPPEKCTADVGGEASLQTSLSTVQKVLGRRDAQTTELHRQLKEARQCLWVQTAEARAASARLQELLADPAHAPREQAETIRQLGGEVKELSARLADARAQEKHWSGIARRQRAFFLQSEHCGQDGLQLLRRHPCGEVFLVPPPVASPYEEGDAAAGREGSGWDVGTSHCNPYKVDSWPFEPNVLAQRASREPNLQQWVEGEDEELEEDEGHADEHGDDHDLEDGEEGEEDEEDDGSPLYEVPEDVPVSPGARLASASPQPPHEAPPRLSGADTARSA